MAGDFATLAADYAPLADSPLGALLGWLGAVAVLIAALAGGLAGARSLIRALADGRRWSVAAWRERQRRDELLDQLLSADSWPNGATSIIEAHRDQYQRISGVDQKLDDVLHQLEAIIERGGRHG